MKYRTENRSPSERSLNGTQSASQKWPRYGQAGFPSEVREFSKSLAESGGKTRNRTGDTRIFSPLLYQLSYLAVTFQSNKFGDEWRVLRRHQTG